MSSTQFTDRAQVSLRLAQDVAVEFGHSYIGTEHLLLGLSREGTGLAHRVLESAGLTAPVIQAAIGRLAGAGKPGAAIAGLTPRLKQVIELAQEHTLAQQQKFIGTEHLLLGILRAGSGVGYRILKEAGLNTETYMLRLGASFQAQVPPQMQGQPRQTRGNTREGREGKGMLEQFSRDLTRMATLNQLDPVLGREEELGRLIQILARRTKNNPALIGEPGVGKTAVVEGLAQRIAQGKVPAELAQKRILSLDLASMVAGTKYRGEFEERVRNIVREVHAQGDIILFVDELHNIVGAGSAEGAIDASNILKPALGRGELQLIGATTNSEYRKYIEKDAALERRFQPVQVKEPTIAVAREILLGLRPRYEAHHRLKITDDALDAAVQLSVRYLPDRYLPDKAVDLMDEAAARVRMGHGASHDGVHEDDIAALVAAWTGVPVQSLKTAERERLLRLEDELHEKIIGQDEAVCAIAKAVRRGRVGLKEPERPTGCFLFLGPTGVGKTALCRALAESLFGSESAMIRFDMSEYSEKHTVSRLMGSPPGYVGHDDGGQLTEQVRRKPYSVVLFDEIEKAHPDVWSTLLQIMEDGTLTDNQGRRANFANTIVIMTSNIGAERITGKGGALGFQSDDLRRSGTTRSPKELRMRVMEDVRKVFRPEFLNRIDETIVFTQLGAQEMELIARNMLQEVGARMEKLGMELDLTDEAIRLLAEKSYDPSNGARPLRRAIREHIENPAAELLLSSAPRGARARLIARGNELELSVI